jgi:hypothetical protein
MLPAAVELPPTGRGGTAPAPSPFSACTSTSTWKIIRAKSDQMLFIRSLKRSNASFL